MKKILIIEDNEDIRENLAEILELAGYETFTAENGKEGVEMAFNHVPDLILCDIMMPVLDGYGVLHILNKDSRTTDIPFIFLTAKSEKTDFRQGMNLGADDYVTKPFEKAELLSVIEIRLKRRDSLSRGTKETNGTTTQPSESKSFDLNELIQDRELRKYKKKESILEEGSNGRYVYFLKSGKVKLYKTNDDGKEFILQIINPGEFFGYIDILKESNYTESAGTLEESELVLIPKIDFFQLVYSNRDVSRRIIKILTNDVQDRENLLINIAYNSVRKKVADALVRIASHFPSDDEHGISIFRDDIAGMAATAKETVIRTLADFKEEKLIDIEEGKIFIRNLPKLEQMVN